MFWYDIVNRDEKSLLHKFYKAQKIKTVKNDWIEQLEKDKIDLEIDLDDKTVKQYSKRKFKKYVKTKIMDATVAYLNNERKDHSKTKNIEFKIMKCKEYIRDPSLNSSEVKLLFALRSKMYSVKNTFKNKFGNSDLYCDLCRSEVDNQEHLMDCEVVKY